MTDATKRWLVEDERRAYNNLVWEASHGPHSLKHDRLDVIAIIDRLCADLDKQQEVIDKLPKCWRLDDNGELVQDVPMYPGMVYWGRFSAGEKYERVEIRQSTVFGWQSLFNGFVSPNMSYASEEAAVAAQGNEDD